MTGLAPGSHASSPHWGSLLGHCPTYWPWPPLLLSPVCAASSDAHNSPLTRLARLRQACRPPYDPRRKREQWSWVCLLTTLQFLLPAEEHKGTSVSHLPKQTSGFTVKCQAPLLPAPTDLNLLPSGHSIPRLSRQKGTVQMYNKPFAPPQILFLVKWQEQDWNARFWELRTHPLLVLRASAFSTLFILLVDWLMGNPLLYASSLCKSHEINQVDCLRCGSHFGFPTGNKATLREVTFPVTLFPITCFKGPWRVFTKNPFPETLLWWALLFF